MSRELPTRRPSDPDDHLSSATAHATAKLLVMALAGVALAYVTVARLEAARAKKQPDEKVFMVDGLQYRCRVDGEPKQPEENKER